MKRLLLGTTLAAVAMFFWGFIYWGLSPVTWNVITPAPDEPALLEALSAALPGPGTYAAPHPKASDEEEAYRRTLAGPIVHVSIHPGRDPMSPFLPGFVHYWISALLMGLLIRRVAPETYGDAMVLSATAAVAAAVWVNLGKPIWFAQAWDYHVLLAVYDLTGWCLAGAILARFARE